MEVEVTLVLVRGHDPSADIMTIVMKTVQEMTAAMTEEMIHAMKELPQQVSLYASSATEPALKS